MRKRVLILPASLGGGHLRAAEAVKAAFAQTHPDASVTTIDVLDLAAASFRSFYKWSYTQLVKRAPWLYGYIYDAADRPGKHDPRRADRLRIWWDRVNLRRFTRLLVREHWDLVIHTHFLPAEVHASLRRSGRLETPHVIVTTDFDTHRLWVCEPAERYFTATDEGAAYLVHYGVPGEKISVTGIPIDPVFSEPVGRHKARAIHGLSVETPVVLQLAGGFGMGPIEGIFRSLLCIESPLQIIVVAGRNEKAQRELAAIEVPRRHRVKVLGFTTEIDTLLAAADIVVSKPGGLTTSEVLARGAVMAIVNPIPGQESRNSDYLLENDAAVKINSLPALPHRLSVLLRDRARLERLRESARSIGRPRAAFEIARLAMGEAR